jgi:hypothetical protein
MHIAHSLLTTFFLILIAVSAAVVVSIVVLALFDLGFGKKNPKVAEEIEDSSSKGQTLSLSDDGASTFTV